MSKQFFFELSTTYNISLSTQQQEAVLHQEGPCLLLAVPGGGKTTTLLSRTAYLVNACGVPADRLLSITFSRASANDMKARFQEIFKGTIPGRISFSTIHSFSYGVIMNYMKANNRQLTLIEGAGNQQHTKGRILRQIYKRVNHDFINEGDYEILTSDLSYVKNIMMTENDLKRYKSDIKDFYKIYSNYEHYKAKYHLMDFDDMLTHCYKILSSDHNVRTYYQNAYDYIQVDEGQDTSRLQHEIIALLVKSNRNIFYVADDDQSIYSFRGADPDYLLNISGIYEDVRIIRMEQNYRSTKAIVHLANRFIKGNRKRYDKDIYTENSQGDPVLIHDVSTRQDQYTEIVRQLKNTDNYREVAVLFRNNHSAVSMVHALSKTSIPYKLKGMKRRFFDHWVVKDIISIMAFAEDTENLQSFQSFYYKLRGYYISKQMINQIEGQYNNRSVFYQIINGCQLEAYQQANIKNMEEDFGHLLTLSVHEAIEFILTGMGYLEFLMDRTGGPTATFESYNMMIQVLKDLGESVKDIDGLKASIQELEGKIQDASNNLDPEALTLSTVHSAKGLEWTNVYMTDLISGIFPNKEVIDSGNQRLMEEERRLFYVGITRAKNNLVIYRVTNNLVSPFVDEVIKILNPKSISSEKVKASYSRKKPSYSIGSVESDDYSPMVPGTAVIHKVYGEGVVKSCTEKRIILCFEDSEKALNYNFCMSNGLITRKL